MVTLVWAVIGLLLQSLQHISIISHGDAGGGDVGGSLMHLSSLFCLNWFTFRYEVIVII